MQRHWQPYKDISFLMSRNFQPPLQNFLYFWGGSREQQKGTMILLTWNKWNINKGWYFIENNLNLISASRFTLRTLERRNFLPKHTGPEILQCKNRGFKHCLAFSSRKPFKWYPYFWPHTYINCSSQKYASVFLYFFICPIPVAESRWETLVCDPY